MMTDEERSAAFEAMKQHTLEAVLGKANAKAAEDDDVEFRDVDKNWNSGKCWMSQARITKPMNNDMTGLAEFNAKMNANHGVVVTVMHDKPGIAVGPIK